MEFQVGDKAVVPALGVGIIKEIETIDLGGDSASFYVIKILDNGLTYKVPIGKSEQNGIRVVMPVDAIDSVYNVLKDRESPADKQTWNRRYREYMNKIKTGDPMEVAHVLRDLAILKSEKTLSFGERKMYDQAHGLIVQEIAVARDVDEVVIKNELENLFQKADAAAARKAKKAGKGSAKKAAKAEPADADEEDED